ncbi:MAG: type 4a pilus biogenesis protein PilO [Proteobacteria bacterium]|nr:hypothetical protein [Desulfobulbaceae bacterium]MBU4153933.1 type 4a pilus biogenesis protein PilO [Pseudomonadota bacterium]MDP2105414.1 hypothetical protein [Desulfobulbaceae bacterium]
MNNLQLTLTKLLALARSRNGLLVIVGVLLLMNGVRLINGKYIEVLHGVESKQALLGQYRMSTKDIEAVRTRVQQLSTRKQQFELQLFQGASARDVTSAMQIKLQEVLARVGLTPESLSPITKGGKGSDLPYGEVTLKVRLGGTLDSFVRFLSELYRMDRLFKVDNFTVKPFKKEELKIFLELKGYYRLDEPSPPAEEKSVSGKGDRKA